MFRNKRAQGAAPSQPEAHAAPRMSTGGYQTIELPTFHGRQRKVVVYTSDASGRIHKAFKR